MRPVILITLAAVAITAGFTGCGTLGKHYDEDLSAPDPYAPTFTVSGRISVESKPTGAMITMNGAQIGISPTSIPIELDGSGNFVDLVEISADFTVVNPVRGVSNVVTARYRHGDLAPKLLVLARPADGGIQSLGSVLSKR